MTKENSLSHKTLFHSVLNKLSDIEFLVVNNNCKFSTINLFVFSFETTESLKIKRKWRHR